MNLVGAAGFEPATLCSQSRCNRAVAERRETPIGVGVALFFTKLLDHAAPRRFFLFHNFVTL